MMTRQQAISISRKKKQLVTRLKNLRRNYMAIIFAGVIKNRSQREIHKELREMTLMFKEKGLPTSKELLKQAVTLSKATKKKKYDEDEIGGLVFLLWNKWNVKGVFDTIVNDEARTYESVLKEEAIEKDSPTVGDNKVFYLISQHADSADDHKGYQGKVYIDENWKRYAPTEEHEEIDALRRQYRMTTFQKIIGRPVWMITRPNCRHYFTRIAAKDITGKSYKQIVQDKDMFLQEGNRPRMQTYRHPTKREWYTRQNAQMMVDKYKDRLKIHRDLYAIDRNEFIARAIKKDKLLIKKWESML